MWAVTILLNDGSSRHYDVAAETERQARIEARSEMIGDLGIEQDWQAEAMIRCMIVGRL